MSIKNKKITELKYFDVMHTFEANIDIDTFYRVPHNLDVLMPTKLKANYWRVFTSICYAFLAGDVDFIKKRCEKKLANKPLGDVSQKLFLHDSLTTFLYKCLRL
jgi:hypothetical protein